MTPRSLLPLLPALLLFLPRTGTGAACLNNVSAGLTGVDGCAVAWGDYDNDGDLDALVTGLPGFPAEEYMTFIYRNNGGPNPTFTDVGVGIPGVVDGALAWGDYDRDGDLDVLITGFMCNTPITRIYRNSGGASPFFTNAYAGLPGLIKGAVAWGDYDNDGDLDILMTGEEYGTQTRRSYLFRSSGGVNPTFANSGVALTGLTRGSASWADYDKDGDLDILTSGVDGSNNEEVYTYQNNGGVNPTFTQLSLFLTRADNSSADWGDYDNDGDLDVLITGGLGFSQNQAEIFRQSSPGNFSEISTPFVGVMGGSAVFGDYNNDGKLDALLLGFDDTGNPRSSVYQAPTFADAGVGLTPVGGLSGGPATGAAGAWGDCDNDGDLDVLLAGNSPSFNLITRVFRNDCGTTNTPPSAPTNLVATVNGNTITFSWSAATDAQTPQAGLTYNLRVGTVPGGSNVISPQANLSTGYRRLPAMGNTNLRTSWTLRVPGAGAYYWSVQAIDGSYAGGLFAAEQGLGVTAVEETLTQNALLRVEGPNPLSSAVTIEFNPPQAARVQIGIYDIAGRQVRMLLNDDMPAGAGTRVWDAKDDAGHDVPSGLYLIRLNTPSEERVKKVTVVR